MSEVRSTGSEDQNGDSSNKSNTSWAVPPSARAAFYKRLNKACLEDDGETLRSMGYIICGIVRWIQRHAQVYERDVVLYRGTPLSEKQQHEVGTALEARSDNVSQETNEASSQMCRMPLFVAASESLSKAQEFNWLRDNGIACPILEFTIKAGTLCDSVCAVHSLSHFPDEREWLMAAYSPFLYTSQRLEYLEIGAGAHKPIKLVMIVSYTVCPHTETMTQFEEKGQDLKTTMLLCRSPVHERAFSTAVKVRDIQKLEYGKEMMMMGHAPKLERESASAPLAMLPARAAALERLTVNASGKMYTETDARAKVEAVRDAERTEAVGLLSDTEEEVARLTAKGAELKQRRDEVLMGKAAKEDTLVKIEEEIAPLERAISTINDEVRTLKDEIEGVRQQIKTLVRRMTSAEKALEIAERRIETAATEISAATAAVVAMRERMAPLQEEERRAFARWQDRQRSSGVDDSIWMTRIAEVEAAGQAYLDSVFPPKDMSALVDAVQTAEQEHREGIAQRNEQRNELVAAQAEMGRCQEEESAIATRVTAKEEERETVRGTLHDVTARRDAIVGGIGEDEACLLRLDSEEGGVQRAILTAWHLLGEALSALGAADVAQSDHGTLS